VALTKEQFGKLYAQGLTPEQIAKFEAGGKPDTVVTVAQHARSKPKRNPGVAALPAVGGIVGGTLGGGVGGVLGTPADVALGPLGTISGAGLGAAAGAGLGGSAGEVLAQLLSGEAGQQSIPEMAAKTAGAGATQAGAEVGGRVLGAIPGAVLKPASRAVNRFLSAQTENVVRAADDAGIHINATEAMDKAIAPFLKRAQAAGMDAVNKLEAFRENFLGNKAFYGPSATGATPQVMPASGAHEAKEYFDALAKGVRDNKQAGVQTPQTRS
jgi:hypothetical protein